MWHSLKAHMLGMRTLQTMRKLKIFVSKTTNFVSSSTGTKAQLLQEDFPASHSLSNTNPCTIYLNMMIISIDDIMQQDDAQDDDVANMADVADVRKGPGRPPKPA